MKKLDKAMQRERVSLEDLAEAISCSPKKVYNCIYGDDEFTFGEAFRIYREFFRGYSMRALFAKELI